MGDNDYPTPGQVEFSADEEQQMRQGRAAQNAANASNQQWQVTPKGQAALTDPDPPGRFGGLY